MPDDYLESTEPIYTPIYTIVMPSNWDDCYHEIAITSLKINECNEIQITGFDYTTYTLISAESTMDNFIDIASFCDLHQKIMKKFG